MSDTPLLEAEGITVQYQVKDQWLTAVSDATFEVKKNEYFGLVGESGCGKSTLSHAILGGLDENGRIESGTLRYKGTEIQDYTDSQYNSELRWNEIAWIPQGSLNSLDPLEKISDQAIEIANVHSDMTNNEALDRLRDLFQIMGLPEERIHDYPHQYSGGMQQRVVIAFALLLDPSLIIADEPTTALDVIMQDQIFKHLDELKENASDTSMVLITHDIALVFESCENMAIMHAGQICETGSPDTLYDNPRHPYSILLQEAFPDIRFPDRDLVSIKGHPPQVFGDIDFCTFVNRCPWAGEECSASAPALVSEDTDAIHEVACFKKDQIANQSETRMN